MDAKKCFLCGAPAGVYPNTEGRELIHYECERCGRYALSHQVTLASLSADQKTKLSAYCRRASGSRNEPVLLTNNIESFIQSLPVYSPSESLDNLLQLVADLTPRINEVSGFQLSRDYPLLVLSGPEVNYLLDELLSRKYLRRANFTDPIQVTMRGWERLEEIRRAGRQSTQAFIAMWFDPTMDDVYSRAIEPAIREAGFKALRIDKFEHVNRIDDEIIGQIKRSRFMVADFTGQRHGVYFEAGMMQGLARNVIWICKKADLHDVHFDNRQFNFIDYETVEEAKKRLYDESSPLRAKGRAHKPRRRGRRDEQHHGLRPAGKHRRKKGLVPQVCR